MSNIKKTTVMRFAKYLQTVILFVLGPCLYAQAQHKWQQSTSGGYTYKYVTGDPMNARFYTLKNGLTVILSPDRSEPRISVRISVRTGSNNDPHDQTGLAHYLEHLLFKGTDKYGTLNWQREEPLLNQISKSYEEYNTVSDPKRRSEIYTRIDKTSNDAARFSIAGEYDNLMAFLGSQVTNAYTSFEETVYMEDIPSNVLDPFLLVQAERFRNPVIRLFHTELETVYEEKNRSLDNDNDKVQNAIFSTLFPTHNYGLQTTIGTVEHLKNPSIKAIKEYYKRYYVPNNIAIAMSGDIDPDDVIGKIDRYFSYMKPAPVKEYLGPVEAPVNGPFIKEVFGPSAESVSIAFRSAKSGSKDAMITELVSAILSNGKAGLVDINLNKQQKVLEASADRKSTRLNSSHERLSRMPSSA